MKKNIWLFIRALCCLLILLLFTGFLSASFLHLCLVELRTVAEKLELQGVVTLIFPGAQA